MVAAWPITRGGDFDEITRLTAEAVAIAAAG